MLTSMQISFVWLVVAAVVAFASLGYAARRTGADREVLHSLVSDVIFWALIGSRLIYGLADPYATLQQPGRLLFLNGLLALRGAAVGAILAVLYHLWRRRLTDRATVNGAVLVLAAAGPALLLAWGPDGAPTPAGATASLGSVHSVGIYYAAIHLAVTAAVWWWPQHAATRYAILLGTAFLMLENFRQAPLLGGVATALQLAGATAIIVGLVISKPNNSLGKG